MKQIIANSRISYFENATSGRYRWGILKNELDDPRLSRRRSIEVCLNYHSSQPRRPGGACAVRYLRRKMDGRVLIIDYYYDVV